MLFLNSITLLQAEKPLESREVRHILNFSECFAAWFYISAHRRSIPRPAQLQEWDVGNRVSHKRGDWNFYLCHREYGTNAEEERHWAAGKQLKSWTKISITSKLYCDFLQTVSPLRSLQLFPCGRGAAEFIPVVSELDFSKGERSGEEHKPLWLYGMLI